MRRPRGQDAWRSPAHPQPSAYAERVPIEPDLRWRRDIITGFEILRLKRGRWRGNLVAGEFGKFRCAFKGGKKRTRQVIRIDALEGVAGMCLATDDKGSQQ